MDKKLISDVASLLGRQDDLQVGIVFGSTVSGQMRSDSDIDIAVQGSAPLSFERKMELRAFLSIELGREIDLIDLMTCHGLLLHQILTTGNIVLKRSTASLAHTLTRMLFEQADYEPLRNRLVLSNLKRGFSGSKSY